MKRRTNLLAVVLCLVGCTSAQTAKKEPLRIMPLGDSITAGYTDNPVWNVPFEFGYRSGLYKRLHDAGHEFQFVGQSPEPWDGRWKVPGNTHAPDLRALGQDKHRGYGGWGIVSIEKNVAKWIQEDHPDVILLLIGINGINKNSPAKLDALVNTILTTSPKVHLIVAQITPYGVYNQHLHDYNLHIRDTLVPGKATQGFKISTVDLYSLFLTDPSDPASIGRGLHSNPPHKNHPTAALYDKMAETWLKALAAEYKATKN